MPRNELHLEKKRRLREMRLPIVAEGIRKSCDIRTIASEVRTRLDITCSTRTVFNDIKYLTAEWRKTRGEDMEIAMDIELDRIAFAERELWAQWEKSKEDYSHQKNKRVGVPSGGGGGEASEGNEIITIKREQEETNVVSLGDPRYIAEIRQQQMERRKILGLYAPEKKNVGMVTTALDIKNLSPEEMGKMINQLDAE